VKMRVMPTFCAITPERMCPHSFLYIATSTGCPGRLSIL